MCRRLGRSLSPRRHCHQRGWPHDCRQRLLPASLRLGVARLRPLLLRFAPPTALIADVTLVHPFDSRHALKEDSLADAEAGNKRAHRADSHAHACPCFRPAGLQPFLSAVSNVRISFGVSARRARCSLTRIVTDAERTRDTRLGSGLVLPSSARSRSEPSSSCLRYSEAESEPPLRPRQAASSSLGSEFKACH
jgi:hypothetical protein